MGNMQQRLTYGEPVSITGKLSSVKTFIQQSRPCPCLVYEIQPQCTNNRHLHARLDQVGCVLLEDQFFKRQWKLHLGLYRTCLLPSATVKGSRLQHVMVVGLNYDMVVLQVFLKKCIRFMACSLSAGICLGSFDVCYCLQQLLLYECHLSENNEYMALKVNYTHMSHIDKDSTSCQVRLVAMHVQPRVCKELPACLPLHHDNTALCFQPSRDRPVLLLAYMSIWGPCFHRFDFIENTLISSEGLQPVSQMFEFVSIQFAKEAQVYLLSARCKPKKSGVDEKPRSPFIINKVHIYLLNRDLEMVGEFDSDSLPVIANWGHKFIQGEQKGSNKAHPQQVEGVRSLTEMCRTLIRELVMPEDLYRLPVPPGVLSMLKCRTWHP